MLKLLPANPDLAEAFLEYRQDPETIKYNPLAKSDIDELRVRLRNSSSDLSEYHKADAFFWFIEVDSEVVGNITLQNINRMMRTCEIGYGTKAAARGRGIATAAIQELTRQVFRQTDLRKLIALVHDENLASVKVLERAGFRKEGCLREHYLVNGIPTNELIFGLLRHEVE